MRKSRLWTAVTAVVGLAALVVLAGCQGLAGPAGPAGAKGDPGTSGPGTEGPPGTTDNLSPVATAIPTVYLALNGVPAPAKAHKGLIPSDSYITKTVPLAMHFKDAESATLSYTAVSTDKTTATASKVVADGKLLITGVKAGPTTITVTAFDGVNAGVEATIDVIVVANNRPPTAGVIQTILDLTGPRKLVSDITQTIAFTAVISPGASGEPTEKIADFRTALDTDASTVTKLVSAKVTAVSGNDYILTVTRKMSGTDDMSGTQEITIFAQDSFGAETMVDLNGPEVEDEDMMVTGEASLVAEVNAPPRLVLPVRDVVLYRTGEVSPAGNAALAPTIKHQSTVFHIADLFAVEYDVTVGVDTVPGDTTCVFTTSPAQPTGLAGLPVTTDTPPVAARVVSPITATTLASVVPNDATDGARDMTPTELNMLTVDSVTPADSALNTATPIFQARGLGDFDLTITCSDAETFATGTWKITVRP